MNKESFIYIVLFTFIATFIFVFILSIADALTKERVAENRELVTAMAFLNAVGKQQEDSTTARETFKEFFGNVDPSMPTHTTIDNKDLIVSGFSGQGLWGTITGVLAVNENVDRILGIDIISHSETPGLGARIEDEWFQKQFRGEFIPADGITVRKGEGGSDEDYDNGIVDGITGASLTGISMQKILNEKIKTLRGEEG